jgi:hypothetical protein
MNKIIIGSLVGAVIMFVWSFLAWMITPIHANTFMYTPAQDAIMKVLAESNLETGTYGMPSAPTKEEQMKIMEENKGKPGAAVYYVKEDPGMGGMQMCVGFILNFIMVFAACLLLIKNMDGSFFSRWWMTMMIAVVIIFGVHLMQWNWMSHSWEYTRSFILDGVIGWGINSLWLAWWFGRE